MLRDRLFQDFQNESHVSYVFDDLRNELKKKKTNKIIDVSRRRSIEIAL